MVWSLRARGSDIGSDSRRSADEGTEEIRQRQQRIQGDHRLGDQRHVRTAFPRRHPLGQETPRPIGELTAKRAAAVHGPLVARDGQRLADERMPAVVDSDGAWKLRSM
jgi:hypothetical protein